MHTATATSTLREAIVFDIGGLEFGIDARHVQEVRGYEKPAPLPFAAPCYEGGVPLRGRVVPVVDLRKKFGYPEPSENGHTATVILNLADRTVGVIVDAVSDAVEFRPGELKRPATEGLAGPVAFIEGVASIGPRTVMLFDVEAYLAQAERGLAGQVR
jgi:purine-binding chemotaxis protein CheW